MARIQIELPDDQAAALQAKLSAQGISGEAWVQKMVAAETPATDRSAKQAVARILELQKKVQPDPDGWSVKDYINYGHQ